MKKIECKVGNTIELKMVNVVWIESGECGEYI